MTLRIFFFTMDMTLLQISKLYDICIIELLYYIIVLLETTLYHIIVLLETCLCISRTKVVLNHVLFLLSSLFPNNFWPWRNWILEYLAQNSALPLIEKEAETKLEKMRECDKKAKWQKEFLHLKLWLE